MITRISNSLANLVASYTDLHTTSYLSQTCRFFNRSVRDNLSKRLFSQLLHHVVNGEQEEDKEDNIIGARKIIAFHPHFLLCRGTVKDRSGRTLIDFTPFELAYAGDDVEMCQMMLPYLDQLPQGREQVLARINIKFPEVEEEVYDFNPIIAAITSDDHEKQELAFAKFRKDVTKKVIKTGKIFNFALIVDAFEILETYKDVWRFHQIMLFLEYVIGYLQRLMSISYMHIHCQGLHKFVIDKNALERILYIPGCCQRGEIIKRYPFDLERDRGLGFGVFLGDPFPPPGGWSPLGGGVDEGLCGLVNKLYEMREEGMNEIKRQLKKLRQLKKPKIKCCVML